MGVATGGCLCGAVRYETRGAHYAEGVCHCRTCQAAHAAPMVGWFSVRRDDLQLTGTLASYRSSDHGVRRFCGVCGAQVLFDDGRYPEEVDVAAVTLDDASVFTPRFHIWTRSQQPWVRLNDDLPRYPLSSRE